MAGKVNNLEDKYVDLLKDLYSAEKQLVEALPKMAKAAQSDKLRKAFEDHLQQTKRHAERIETIFQTMEGSPRGKKCYGMEGLIHEGGEVMKEKTEPQVLDAGLISAAQRVEHYEMVAYDTAATWAKSMGDENAARLLQQTLNEERMANEKLTMLAEREIVL